jgi:hypothetical protein
MVQDHQLHMVILIRRALPMMMRKEDTKEATKEKMMTMTLTTLTMMS